MSSITFFLCFIPVLALILLALNLIFAPHSPYLEKSSTFECGFHSFLGQNRTQFSVSYFLFGIIYLIFTLEILIAYPAALSLSTIGEYGFAVFLIFFLVLTLGFAFEIGKKALSIDSRQYNQVSNLKSEVVSIKYILNIVLEAFKLYCEKFNWKKILLVFFLGQLLRFYTSFNIFDYISIEVLAITFFYFFTLFVLCTPVDKFIVILTNKALNTCVFAILSITLYFILHHRCLQLGSTLIVSFIITVVVNYIEDFFYCYNCNTGTYYICGPSYPPLPDENIGPPAGTGPPGGPPSGPPSGTGAIIAAGIYTTASDEFGPPAGTGPLFPLPEALPPAIKPYETNNNRVPADLVTEEQQRKFNKDKRTWIRFWLKDGAKIADAAIKGEIDFTKGHSRKVFYGLNRIYGENITYQEKMNAPELYKMIFKFEEEAFLMPRFKNDTATRDVLIDAVRILDNRTKEFDAVAIRKIIKHNSFLPGQYVKSTEFKRIPVSTLLN